MKETFSELFVDKQINFHPIWKLDKQSCPSVVEVNIILITFQMNN